MLHRRKESHAIGRGQRFHVRGGASPNVVLLVLADEALKIGPLQYQITGILGIPVLRALGRVGISKRGLLRIHESKTVVEGEIEPVLLW